MTPIASFIQGFQQGALSNEFADGDDQIIVNQTCQHQNDERKTEMGRSPKQRDSPNQGCCMSKSIEAVNQRANWKWGR